MSTLLVIDDSHDSGSTVLLKLGSRELLAVREEQGQVGRDLFQQMNLSFDPQLGIIPTAVPNRGDNTFQTIAEYPQNR